MQCYNVNQSGAAPCGPFRSEDLFSSLSASMELSGEIFAVRHSPYPVSKFELGRPSECGENGWERFFVTNKNINVKKDDENSRPLKASKLGSHVVRNLGNRL